MKQKASIASLAGKVQYWLPPKLVIAIERSEKLKIKLSALERVSCSVRHSGDRTRLEVTREEFEELSQDLVHQTIDYVHKLLSDANLKASDVDTVLLVGGSTRMPMIRNAVEAVFPGKIRGEDSNLAISKGAALCSKLL